MPHVAHAVPLPYLPPAEAFRRLVGEADVFWLDSSLPRGEDTRYSILGCAPRWVLSAHGGAWRIETVGQPAEYGGAGALAELEARLGATVSPAPAAAHLPFYGGAVGWFSYDLGRQFEDLGTTAADDLGTPDLRLAWYDAALVFDHAVEAAWLVGPNCSPATLAAIDRLRTALGRTAASTAELGPPPSAATAVSNVTRAEYLARVAAVRDRIAAGELYQLNLVQRYACPLREPPAAAYLRLRTLNPAPFAAFIAAEPWTVLCSSPERFLEVTPDGDIRTCPIKGTRARGATAAEDAARREELRQSDKERAELLMIVDLLRNDLGRVCTTGSVEVTRLHALESFATVHHLVGEVRGRLRPGTSRGELLRAVFPGGSITGAPKVSAMRAIEALEPHRRGIGMGSLGYVSAHGRIDLNIAIRTIIAHGNTAYVPVGAGVVWDSDPAAEYAETLAKAAASFAALGVTPAP